MYLFIYLALVGECTYPVLRAIMHYIVARDPVKWLIKAAKNGDLDIVQCAAAQGNPDQHWWNDCMSWAARGGRLHIVQYAASRGAKNWVGCMAWAASYGHLDIMQYAASQRDSARVGNWYMVQASSGGHLDIVQYAVSQGANAWDACMKEAVDQGHQDIVDFLRQCKSKASQSEN